MNIFVINLMLASVLILHVYSINSQNLANLLFRSRLASQDPARSMGCFSDYVIRSNEVSESYGQHYNNCSKIARSSRHAIDDEMINQRIAISESTQALCKSLSICNNLNSTLEIFHCHERIGANNTKAAYGISGNASEYANIMQERNRIIDLRHEQCYKNAERRYVEGTAAKYRNLQYCLDGKVKPSPSTTTTTTTTTPEPTTTTTPQPTTTTTTSAPNIPNTTTSKESEIVKPTSVTGTE